MKTIFLSLILSLFINLSIQAQMNDALPYMNIPDAPESYTPGTVISRVIDGLGFRYYWASEGLTEDDLAYAPGNNGRSMSENLTHIYELSTVILNAAKKLPNDRSAKPEVMTSIQQRKKTLENLKLASELFAESIDLSSHAVVFKSKDGTASYPFWNGINGPIEDALWHAGQLVVMRRSAGNPINSKVNVFLGRLND